MPPKEPPQPSQAQMQSAMNDMQHVAMAIQPSPSDPNAEVPLEKIILACASAPGMLASIPEEHPSKTDAVEEAFEKAGVKLDWINTEGISKKNAILLYWKLHRQQGDYKKIDDDLDTPTQQHASACLQITMKLMMQAQMLLPHQGWVAATVGIARASALFANQLWSHEDKEALDIMEEVLKGEGLRAPKLRLEAKCSSKKVAQSAKVTLKVTLHRDHHGFNGKKPPQPADPSGNYEAYWMYVYVVGASPEEPNTFAAIQPLMCKALKDKTIEAEPTFEAPARAGPLTVAVCVTSTSTVGVSLEEKVTLTVTDQVDPAAQVLATAKAIEKMAVQQQAGDADEEDDIGIKLK